MYLAYLKRTALEQLELRKDMTIASFTGGIYANTNYDAKENANKRGEAIGKFSEALQEGVASARAQIYNADDPNAVDEVDMDDPFFAAMKLGYEDPDLKRTEE